MRKNKLIECNPKWSTYDGKDHSPDALAFDCPEGHEGCRYIIPFAPALDGGAGGIQTNGVFWERKGDTFETLTLAPSIRGIPRFNSKEEAVAAGVNLEWAHPRMFCACHIFIQNGQIVFCGDSH